MAKSHQLLFLRNQITKKSSNVGAYSYIFKQIICICLFLKTNNKFQMEVVWITLVAYEH